MTIRKQEDVIAFLKETFEREAAAPIEIIETHISRIFLVDDRAFKMKRAVKGAYRAMLRGRA